MLWLFFKCPKCQISTLEISPCDYFLAVSRGSPIISNKHCTNFTHTHTHTHTHLGLSSSSLQWDLPRFDKKWNIQCKYGNSTPLICTTPVIFKGTAALLASRRNFVTAASASQLWVVREGGDEGSSVWQTRWGKLKMASAPFITTPQKTASLSLSLSLSQKPKLRTNAQKTSAKWAFRLYDPPKISDKWLEVLLWTKL